MDFNQIVNNALEYYDTNTIKYYEKIKKYKYYQLSRDEGKIFFYDESQQKIDEYGYDVIGKHLFNENIWVWGWSDGFLEKQNITLSRKLLNYALDLSSTDILLKTAFITSRIQIDSQYQIDINVALASFLSKHEFIYKLNFYGGFDAMNKIKQKQNPEKVYYLGLYQKNI